MAFTASGEQQKNHVNSLHEPPMQPHSPKIQVKSGGRPLPLSGENGTDFYRTVTTKVLFCFYAFQPHLSLPGENTYLPKR